MNMEILVKFILVIWNIWNILSNIILVRCGSAFFSVRSCAFNVVKCFFRIKDRNRAEEIERKGAIGQSMSPEWIVVILKNEKISLKAVEDTSEFFLNG